MGFARLKLTRSDGLVYLNRWGFEWKRVGGVFIHKMSARDPGDDVHDHPWTFLSLILKGGYIERRANLRNVGHQPHRGRRLGSLSVLRLDEAHTITHLKGKTSWSLVLHGPNVRQWGFYIFDREYRRWRWVDHLSYAASELGQARHMSVMGS